jgi:hypothetical protein
LVKRLEEVATWSPKEGGLITLEDSGEVLAFNFEKINSEDCDRSVPAVVGGPLTAMDVMSGMPIRKGPSRRGSSATSAVLAA